MLSVYLSQSLYFKPIYIFKPKVFSYRQHKVGSCFLSSLIISLLIALFNLFTFKVIIALIGFVSANLLFVFHILHVFFASLLPLALSEYFLLQYFNFFNGIYTIYIFAIFPQLSMAQLTAYILTQTQFQVILANTSEVQKYYSLIATCFPPPCCIVVLQIASTNITNPTADC